MGKATQHSAVLIAAFAITSLLNYAFGVGLSWFFSPEQFGVLGVAQSLLLLTALAVGAGFPWIAAHDLASGNAAEVTRRRFRAAWIYNVGLGILLALGLWFAYRSGVLRLGSAYRSIVPLISLTTVLLAARSVINGAARGLYKFVPFATNMVADVVLKVAVGLGLVAAGVGVEGVIAAFAAATAIALVHSFWIVRPHRLWKGSGWFDGQVMRTTVPLFMSMFGPALILNLDILGLKILTPLARGDHLAGLYQAAVILARTPVFLAQSLTLVLFSYAATAALKGQQEGPKDHLKAAGRIWTRLLLPGALVFMLAPQAVMRLFLPPRYLEAGPALRIAAAGGLLLALMTLFNGVFQAAGDRRRPAIVAGLALLVQISILVGLVPHWGINAAALSLLAAGITGGLGLLPSIISTLALQAGSLLTRFEGYVYRIGLPVSALALVMLVLPDGTRIEAFFKLLMGGITYLITLSITHFKPNPNPDRPVRYLLTQFVNVLMGG